MNSALIDYFDALDRLIKDKPNVLPKGSKITNDAVALEAGRNKGAIKKSRLLFSDLIAVISVAKEKQVRECDNGKNRLDTEKQLSAKYRKLYEESIAREINLIREIEDLKGSLLKVRSMALKVVK